MAKQIAGDRRTPRTVSRCSPTRVDPRKAILELDPAVPKDWDIIVAGGHCFSIAMTHMHGRPAGKYHVLNDFGAIGSGLSAAIGVAAARDNGKVMLIDGDGSLLMHIQELETIRRQGISMLICDHERRRLWRRDPQVPRQRRRPEHAIHGRGDLAGVARGFGLRGATVTQPGRFEALFREHQAAKIGTAVGRPYRRPDPVAQLPPRALAAAQDADRGRAAQVTVGASRGTDFRSSVRPHRVRLLLG